MAERLGALTALEEDPEFIPSISMHREAHNHLQLQFWGTPHLLFCLFRHHYACDAQTRMKAKG